jgi:hypothetical protein
MDSSTIRSVASTPVRNGAERSGARRAGGWWPLILLAAVPLAVASVVISLDLKSNAAVSDEGAGIPAVLTRKSDAPAGPGAPSDPPSRQNSAALAAANSPASTPDKSASLNPSPNGAVARKDETSAPARRKDSYPGREDDPDWIRYLELTRSALENSPGYSRPEDPEWRSVVTGRRDAPPVYDRLDGGEPSLESLARAVLAAACAGQGENLDRLKVTKTEFLRIFWPEFPASRPATGTTEEFGWWMNYSTSVGGIGEALSICSGRRLALERADFASKEEFRNFLLYRGVTIQARDEVSGDEILLGFAPVVAERQGRFKVFTYTD